MTYDPAQYDSAELKRLVDALLHETITAEQHLRLQEILRTGEAARLEYLSNIDVHVGLKDLQINLDEVLVPAISCEDPSVTSRAWMSQRPMWALVSVCCLTLLAVTATLLMTWPGGRRLGDPNLNARTATEHGSHSTVTDVANEPVVVLTQAANAELHLEYLPAIGESLRMNHEYVLLKGQLEMRFKNGATATLKSPSVFTVKSGSLMELKLGNCSVHAPEDARGFEVITPQSRIVDLGTRFSVVANETGVSDVQVLEGKIEVHSPDRANQWSTLEQGEAIRLSRESGKPSPIPFNPSSFQGEFPDRVVSYDATEAVAGEGVRDLTSVTVQRGGQVQTYPVQELIGIDVIHFSSFSNSANGACLDNLPESIATQLSDNVALTSGLVNFSREPGPYVPASNFADFRSRYGMAVRFRQPVINAPGPDVVIFEVQSAAYPARGDQFYVSPIEDGAGLRTHTVERFDIMLNSTDARKVAPLSSIVFESPIRSLDDFSRVRVVRTNKLSMPFYALAVGIDLSDLGYPAGAEASGLFLEDVDDEDHVVMDPVFIGGLPTSGVISAQ